MKPIKENNFLNIINWILRIGLSGTFVGHGILAIQIKASWLVFITFWGFSLETAQQLMPLIGFIDILVAFLIIVKPFRFLLVYAFIWTFLTALMRPLTGLPIWDFVERMANWTIPLALLFIQYLQNSKDKK